MPVIHSQPPAKPITNVEPYQQMVSLERLSQKQKYQLWQGIKRDRPSLATLLKDQELAEIKNFFNGQIQLPKEDVKAYMERK